MAASFQRFGEKVRYNIKIAMLVGMLPKVYQDMAMQNGSLMSVMKYESVRDDIINVATQKAAMATPKPMDIDPVNQSYEGW